MPKSNYWLLKLALIGDKGTDKTGLIKTFCQPPPVITIDNDYYFKLRTIELDFKTIKLLIYDTDRQDRFVTFRNPYCSGTSGFVIVYSINDRSTFESISERYQREVEKQKTENAVVMLLGNKCHLEDIRQVSIDEGKKLADKFGFLFFEASSENNINVEQAFVTLTQAIMEISDGEIFLRQMLVLTFQQTTMEEKTAQHISTYYP